MIRSAKALLLIVSLAGVCLGQNTTAPAPTAPDTKASAYYNFAMGRLYAELAAAEGNREYVNRAIQHYQEALKADPSAGIIFDELTDLYLQSNRLSDAVTQAEDLLKQNPNNLDARRMLARIYTRLASGNTQEAKINEDYLKKAIDQYQKITTQDASDAESWVTLGKLYRASSDSAAAEKAFNAGLKADPDNEDALTGLALMYSEQGDTAKAVEKLKTLTDKNPNERTLAALAQQYEQMNDYKSAAEVLQRALALNPDDDRLGGQLALDLAESGQYDESAKIYQQLATENPKELRYPLQLSRIYLSQFGNAKDKPQGAAALAKAEDWFKKAKALDPDNGNLEVRELQVNLFEAQGKTDNAITALKSMLEDTTRRNYSAIESRQRAALLKHLALIYRNNKQYTQSVEALRQIVTLDSDQAIEASLLIVQTYRIANDMPSAQKEADAALQKFPTNRMVIEEHAEILADSGKVDAAVTELKALLKDGPGDREVQLELAQVYEKGKRWAEVVKALDAAERLSTSDRDKEAVFFMRGAMLERQKKYDASEAAFRKVLEMNPKNAGALNYLGYMLADRDVRLDEASQLIRQALDLEPDNGAYMDSLGWVYFRQGKLNDAEGLLQRALDKMQDPTVHDHLGDVYLKLGKTKEAIAQWQASLREFQKAPQSDNDPEVVAKVNKKLDEAQSRLAREMHQK